MFPLSFPSLVSKLATQASHAGISVAKFSAEQTQLMKPESSLPFLASQVVVRGVTLSGVRTDCQE